MNIQTYSVKLMDRCSNRFYIRSLDGSVGCLNSFDKNFKCFHLMLISNMTLIIELENFDDGLSAFELLFDFFNN